MEVLYNVKEPRVADDDCIMITSGICVEKKEKSRVGQDGDMKDRWGDVTDVLDGNHNLVEADLTEKRSFAEDVWLLEPQ